MKGMEVCWTELSQMNTAIKTYFCQQFNVLVYLIVKYMFKYQAFDTLILHHVLDSCIHVPVIM